MRRTAAGIAGIALVLLAAPVAAQEPAPAPPPEAPAPPPAPVTPPPEPARPASTARPSIIVDAKDDLGKDVRAVTVYVDDAPFAYELDGRPLEVDPGTHVIRVQRNDGSRATGMTSITVKEGEINQRVHFAFEKAAPPPPELEPESAPVLPRVVAGVGIASFVTGVVLLLARPTMPTNCNADTSRCTKLPAESDVTFDEDRSKAQTNRDFLHAGLVTLIAGAGVTALGATWYVLKAPKSQDARAVRLQVAGSTIRLQATF